MRPGDVDTLGGGCFSLDRSTHAPGTPGAPLTFRAHDQEQPLLLGTGPTSTGGQLVLRNDWSVIRDLKSGSGATVLTLENSAAHNVIESSTLGARRRRGPACWKEPPSSHVRVAPVLR